MKTVWKYVKFKELISELGDGGTPSTSDESNFGGDIPWAVVDDIKSKITFTKTTLTEKGFSKCSAKIWPKGSVIVTTGASIGNVGIAEIDLCTKQGITGIVLNEHANNLFIKYWLESNTNQLLRYSQGTTFKEIRPRPLGNLKVKLPEPFTKKSLIIQDKIADVLSLVDNNIEQTKKVIEKAEKLKKSMMQNLLTGRMKPDGTYRKKEEFYEDEKYGLIPKGWEIKKIKEIAQVIMGQSPDSKTYNEELKGLPFVQGMADMGEKYPTIRKYTSDPKKESLEGDLLFTVRAPVGKIFINNLHISIGRGIAALREYSNTKYLYYYLINWEINFKKYEQGTTFTEIDQRELKNIKIILPSLENEQRDIVSRIINIDNKIEANKQKLQSLEKLKKSLMQNLLTGKIEIPENLTIKQGVVA